MQQAAIVESVDSGRDHIGTRAATHLDLAWRQFARGPGVEQREYYMRIVTGEPHPFGNLAIVLSPDDPAVAQAAIGPLLSDSFPALLLCPCGLDEAVAGTMIASGFTDQGSMPAMAVDIERMASSALPPDYAVVRVGADEAGRSWTETVATGFGLPPAVAQLFSPEVHATDLTPDASTQFFAVIRDGRTVATSLLLLADGLAGIYCVATLQEERGKGLGAHVTAEALRAAGRLGYRVGILQSSAMGHSVYEGLGFKDVGGVQMFLRRPG